MAVQRNLAALAVAVSGPGVAASVAQCVGGLGVSGHGGVELVATQWNQPGMPAGAVRNVGGNVQPEMWGRAYFAEGCKDGTYDNNEYSSVKLLGKKLSFTTDVSGAGCGCNAAMYLVSMPQNSQESGCYDYYCDANSVCGPNCAEIDIMEANRFAFHAALHKAYDGGGDAAGYGGWVKNNEYAFDGAQYGPSGSCVNTNAPYRVEAAFPAGADGRLAAMQVTLSQNGRTCPTITMNDYAGMDQLSKALAEGMTPVVSYWKAEDMLWMDGPGTGSGPCQQDTQLCQRSPQFYNFAVESLGGEL